MKENEKPAYKNIHLFNELAELKAQGRLLSENHSPEIGLLWKEDHGFLVIPDNINQHYDFKIE